MRIFLSVLLTAGVFAPRLVAAAPSVVSGRLTDQQGVAIPGATVLVYPAATSDGLAVCRDATGAVEPAGVPAGGVPTCALVRTGMDGGFVVLLPPGRYMVAAVKPGYEVALTEVHSLASRVVRLRLEPLVDDLRGKKPAPGQGLEWLLRGKKDDILRDVDEAMAEPFEVVVADAGTGARPTDLLGAIDGDVTQSLTAGDLPGLSSASIGDAGRATTLAVRAPVGESLAWNFVAGTARSEAELAGTGEAITGGADRMLAGAEYGGADRGPRGAAQIGMGRVTGGTAGIRDSLLAAAGSLPAVVGDDPVVVSVQAWSADAELGETGYLALDGPAAAASGDTIAGRGVNLYAGSAHEFGAATTMRYGLEYRTDTLHEGASVLPRVGMSHAIGGGAGLALDGELLLDPAGPGGRMALESRPDDVLRIAAAVAVVPEFATMSPGGPVAPVPAGAPAPAPLAGGRRSIDLSVARDFGPLHGSVTGSLGRIGRRSLPAIEEGPVPIVSTGGERYYETRVGVAWRPSTTEMQVGYRRAQADIAGASGGDYRRLDLVVSQGLPAPRALMGARLRALLSWQQVAYDALLGGAGAPASGMASRLSGGVGLSF